ncbi:MAG: smc 4 [Chthoniobacteraceae bacterium]|nr:smc 4 [Chthoniobacteraceae bacterium]
MTRKTRRRYSRRINQVVAAFALFGTLSLRAEEPLHTQIDALIARANPLGQAAIASDADFLRRVYLALHGVIPTAAQARSFFADAAVDKRAKIVDLLLADPQFAKWMAVRFDVLLMERRAEAHTKSLPWCEWLEESFKANKHWDTLVGEMLTQDGADEKTRHLARWLLEREADSNALTKDTARIFLGRDIGCSQCHDHPRIDDYSQRDYAGLQAFFSRTYLFRPDLNKPGFVGEQAAGETNYMSVFTNVGGGTKPRLPGEGELEEPPPGEWTVPPNDKDKNLRPIPKNSRRAILARVLGDGHHPAFRRNIANRLWALVFGRGLVEPLDLQHSANPPSNPALLELLSEQVALMKFDMRAFIRELALTDAFQRTLDLPELPADFAKAAAEKVPALEQEALTLTSAASEVEAEASTALKATIQAQRAAAPVKMEQTKLEAAAVEAKKLADAAAAEQKKAEDALALKRDAQKLLSEAAIKISDAVAKVGETPQLVSAAKTFESKAAATATEIPGVEKQALAMKSESDSKMHALAAVQETAAAGSAKLQEAEKAVVARQSAFAAAAARKETERIKAKFATAQASQLKAAMAWANATALEKPLREVAATSEASYLSAKQTADRLAAEVAAAQGQLSILESNAAAATIEVTKANEALTAKGPAAAALAEAAAKAVEAATKLPGDAEIKNAAAIVKAGADEAAAAVVAIQKNIAEAQSKSGAVSKQYADVKAAIEKEKADLAATLPQLPGLEETLKAARAKVDESALPVAAAREGLSAAWGRSFAAGELLPLAPEQLCWSVMQSTGQLEQHRVAAANEWDAKNKLSDADKADPAKTAERAAAIEKLFREKIRGYENQFVRSFGGAAGQPQTDFFATPEQALYFENGGVTRQWAASLASRAAGLPEPKTIAEELYLSTLTRMPSESEVAELAATVAARPPEKKSEALTDYAWALLTSTEFRFLH